MPRVLQQVMPHRHNSHQSSIVGVHPGSGCLACYTSVFGPSTRFEVSSAPLRNRCSSWPGYTPQHTDTQAHTKTNLAGGSAYQRLHGLQDNSPQQHRFNSTSCGSMRPSGFLSTAGAHAQFDSTAGQPGSNCWPLSHHRHKETLTCHHQHSRHHQQPPKFITTCSAHTNPTTACLSVAASRSARAHTCHILLLVHPLQLAGMCRIIIVLPATNIAPNRLNRQDLHLADLAGVVTRQSTLIPSTQLSAAHPCMHA